jgi:hypothetical protein
VIVTVEFVSGRYFAREQPALQGRVNDNRNVVLYAVGDYLVFDTAIDHRVGRLVRGDGYLA